MTSRLAWVALFFFSLLVHSANSAIFSYVDWTAADPAAGTASGTISLPGGSSVGVNFDVLNPNGSHGTYTFAQTNGGTNYWNPSAPYISSEVENPPPTTDILALTGGDNQVYRVTLSEPIKDPIMAIVSLGRAGLAVDYNFDSPFSIVSQGTGYWGGTSTSLTQLSGDVLRGTEGHGTIRFNGTFSTFSWVVPVTEYWHGFTYGIRTTEAMEPTPAEPASVILAVVALCVGAISRAPRRPLD
jgi:hypothetical protein